MKKWTKVLAIIIAAVLALTAFAGCTPKDPTDDPQATKAPADDTPDDKPATTEIIAKVGDIPLYACEFYYFLYSGLRNVYYKSEGVYDATLSDEDNYKKMIEYFHTEKEDGTTYLDDAIKETLNIAVGFKIAEAIGKEYAASDEKYAVSNDYLKEVLNYVDQEADYGAAVYKCTRDEYFFYAYGMNVNDAKRYTESQLYASILETAWADKEGFSFNETAPTAPKDDADEATKAKYEADLKEYNEKKNAHFEAFRAQYEEKKDTFNIPSIRFLFLETKDLKDDAKEEKNKLAEKIIGLVADGMEFENLVKGYSDASESLSNGGLIDINLFESTEFPVPFDVIEWAGKETEAGGEIKRFDVDEGIYLVRVEGITDFDGTKGVVADEKKTTYDLVRENVRYSILSEKYNDYLNEQAETERFKLNEENAEQMKKLANDYLEYDASAFEKK